MRPRRLPDLLEIAQSAGEVRISDSTGITLETIATGELPARSAGSVERSTSSEGARARSDAEPAEADTTAPGAGGGDSAGSADQVHGVIRADDEGFAADSTVVMAGNGVSNEARAPAAGMPRRLDGSWKSGRLEVRHTGPQGSKVTQTYALEDKGRSLVIRTHIESDGPRPPLDFKRVYRKVTSS